MSVENCAARQKFYAIENSEHIRKQSLMDKGYRYGVGTYGKATKMVEFINFLAEKVDEFTTFG